MLVTFPVAITQDGCYGQYYHPLCRKFNIFCSSNMSSFAGQTNVYRPISFFARLSATTTLNKNSIVKFDDVSVNEGNHFNSGDGIFVAPVSGTYQFSWTTITTSGKLTETELRVDNAIKETLHISLGAGNISGTKVVLCKVGKGDHVWIQTSNSYGTKYLGC